MTLRPSHRIFEPSDLVDGTNCPFCGQPVNGLPDSQHQFSGWIHRPEAEKLKDVRHPRYQCVAPRKPKENLSPSPHRAT